MDDGWIDTIPPCRNCHCTFRAHKQNAAGAPICSVEVNGAASQYGAGLPKPEEK